MLLLGARRTFDSCEPLVLPPRRTSDSLALFSPARRVSDSVDLFSPGLAVVLPAAPLSLLFVSWLSCFVVESWVMVESCFTVSIGAGAGVGIGAAIVSFFVVSVAGASSAFLPQATKVTAVRARVRISVRVFMVVVLDVFF